MSFAYWQWRYGEKLCANRGYLSDRVWSWGQSQEWWQTVSFNDALPEGWQR